MHVCGEGKSLCLPLNIAVNLKLLFKSTNKNILRETYQEVWYIQKH